MKALNYFSKTKLPLVGTGFELHQQIDTLNVSCISTVNWAFTHCPA